MTYLVDSLKSYNTVAKKNTRTKDNRLDWRALVVESIHSFACHHMFFCRVCGGVRCMCNPG